MNPLLASAKTVVSVTVEYSGKSGERVSRTFTGTSAVSDSRAFYKTKMKAGSEPKVVSAARAFEPEVRTMAKKSVEAGAEVEKPVVKAPKTVKEPAAPKAPKPEKVKAEPNGGSRDSSKVGYLAKCQSDCKWNAMRVEFYKALRKIGKGTAAQISAASEGKITPGNCLHYGYHGVTPGLNKAEKEEGSRSFVFTLTAKGKTINLDKQLESK